MSDDPMLTALEAEERKLMAELEQTPAFRKLKLAQKMIAEYRASATPKKELPILPLPAGLSATSQAALTRAVEPIVKAHQTKMARVEAAAAEYLEHRGRRATSGELLPAVLAKNIEITGKIPSKTLSSYLSNSKRFDNVPTFGGYGLREWNGRRTAPTIAQAEPPTPPDDSPASATKGFFN
jgi:hypothetical protein